jgi:hypothetical protein
VGGMVEEKDEGRDGYGKRRWWEGGLEIVRGR